MTSGQGKKKGPGRPTKRTPSVEEQILRALRDDGAPLCVAAAEAGIVDSTLRRWRRSDPDFARACEKAEAGAARSMIAALYRDGMAGDAASRIYWLKCRVPSMREPKAAPIGVDIGALKSIDDVVTAYDQVAEAAAGGADPQAVAAVLATLRDKRSGLIESDLARRVAALEQQ